MSLATIKCPASGLVIKLSQRWVAVIVFKLPSVRIFSIWTRRAWSTFWVRSNLVMSSWVAFVVISLLSFCFFSSSFRLVIDSQIIHATLSIPSSSRWEGVDQVFLIKNGANFFRLKSPRCHYIPWYLPVCGPRHNRQLGIRVAFDLWVGIRLVSLLRPL